MGIRISSTIGDLTNIELLTADDMRELGLQLRERIIRRTIAGTDKDGQAFAPYSRPYAEQKRKALGGGGTVNLQVSGAMLNDITVIDVEGWPRPRVELGFSK